MQQTWKKQIDGNCDAIETEILGFSFRDRNLLIRALLRKAAYKDKDLPTEYYQNGHQIGLDTFGDKVLDFVIYDHFIDIFLSCEHMGKKKLRGLINGYREWYSRNEILEDFSFHCIALQKYVILGTDEFDKKIWDQPKTKTKMLADSFEALVGAVYKDQGILKVKDMLENIGYYEKIDLLHFQKGQKKSDFHIIQNG
jgi:dsRNA-specific ribonuclease